MKTTLELPDELMRAARVRAAQEGRKLKDVMADFIRRGLSEPTRPPGVTPRRVRLPLIECAHEARPGEEMTPERVAQVLAQEDARMSPHAP